MKTNRFVAYPMAGDEVLDFAFRLQGRQGCWRVTAAGTTAAAAAIIALNRCDRMRGKGGETAQSDVTQTAAHR